MHNALYILYASAYLFFQCLYEILIQEIWTGTRGVPLGRVVSRILSGGVEE